MSKPEIAFVAFVFGRVNLAMGFAAFWLVSLAFSVAHAHGEYKWIEDGHYVDPRSGIHCCGEKDCHKLDPEDVSVVPGGFFIRSLNEFVPAAEYQISEDGKWWRCHKFDDKKSRRCFFGPGMGT